MNMNEMININMNYYKASVTIMTVNCMWESMNMTDLAVASNSALVTVRLR